jgi:hypothetical protein
MKYLAKTVRQIQKATPKEINRLSEGDLTSGDFNEAYGITGKTIKHIYTGIVIEDGDIIYGYNTGVEYTDGTLYVVYHKDQKRFERVFSEEELVFHIQRGM